MQAASRLLMVRPAAFAFNTQTAGSNKFQAAGKLAHEAVHQAALSEFDNAVRLLRAHSIDVTVVDDTPQPVKPDAIFPNNWFSVHEECVVVYPMAAPNRRLERRRDVLDALVERTPHRPVINLTQFERDEKFLEGTGSMVLDRINRKAFACVSERTHPDLVQVWCRAMRYEPVLFHASVPDNGAVYHTNVVMAIGIHTAVCCLAAIQDSVERSCVAGALAQHDVIEITLEQMKRFAGNALLVRNRDDAFFWLMSTTALAAFDSEQTQRLQRDGSILALQIPTVEAIGGGSVRCMLAETAW